MAQYSSYVEQVAHYFNRPQRKQCLSPLVGPAAWRGEDIRSGGDARFELSAAQCDELCAALETAKKTHKALTELKTTDFPLPTLGAEIANWRQQIQRGCGFQLVSGLPTQHWSQAECELVFWCLGLHMGRPGAQNPEGDLLGHVVDDGSNQEDPFVRLYRTTANIRYHCDAADVVGLLCLQSARSGGESRIVSSVSVYNELLKRHPRLIPRLYEAFLLDARNEDESGAIRYLPIPPCCFDGEQLRTFFHSDYYRSGPTLC